MTIEKTVKIIERQGRETIVDGKHLDMSKLIHIGSELITGIIGAPFFHDAVVEEVKKLAVSKAEEYDCDYVMIGYNTYVSYARSHLVRSKPMLQTLDGESLILFIADFYCEKNN